MVAHPLDKLAAAASALSLLIWMLWIFTHRTKALYAVPPLTWTANVLLFYSTMGLHSPALHETWSDFLILHASLLVFGIGVAMFAERMEAV